MYCKRPPDITLTSNDLDDLYVAKQKRGTKKEKEEEGIVVVAAAALL